MNETQVAKAWEDLINQGNEAFAKRRLAKAEEFFVEALAKARTFPDSDYRLAKSLHNLAALYHSQGKYAFAEDHYLESLAVSEKIFGRKSKEVAFCLQNLALVFSAKGSYVEAEPYFLEAIAIKEHEFGVNHNELAPVLSNYAKLLQRMERQIEANVIQARIDALC